jgi:CubicO group peptidase (beta-lactamase class C family)
MPAQVLEEGTPDEAGFDPATLDRIRSRAASWVSDGLTPALVLLAARRGVVALHEAYGQLTPDSETPALSVDSVFPCASLCKPLTASVLLMLVEEGLVNLQLPAIKYLPELSGSGVQDVLVSQLLTHTSGYEEEEVMAFAGFDELIVHYRQFDNRPRDKHLNEQFDQTSLDPKEHPTIRRALEATFACPLSRPPGELMSYCDYGYDLVAEIIRRVSGQPLDRFMKQRVFEPLGMRDSSLRLEPEFEGRIVKREPRWAGPRGFLVDDESLDTPWGSRGLNTTAMDIARFGQTILNGGTCGSQRLLSAASVREMTRNQIPEGIGEISFRGSAVQASYGYGWFVIGDQRWSMNGSLLPIGTYSHSGFGGTVLWVDSVNDVVGVFFSVGTWEGDSVMPESPDEIGLGPAPFQDMVTAAVVS